ncbi:SCP2 sterol-binding domain-containing protein [Nostoc sp. MS1]|uniref:SCP2 sterol-binding domain-containing protein n=1 Tax=Nostoc sp. MS1 TaxID=2764711 RepID=UPI001CC4D505|nr:SCP2 sterol-binding domain-containing protein [Nostoc sp. MS1]BCL33871.1 hypothetical protein NSMS1_03180 [Nostoc sp. MS1]
MAVDIQNLFNEKLPAGFAKNPGAAKEINAKYQWHITGEGGGSWYVDASDSGPSVTQGDPGKANCTVKISSEDFQTFYLDPRANSMQLYFSGKLQITGDQMLAMKIGELFKLSFS